MWRFGCENWGSRRGRSGMVSVTGLFQAQVPWIAWKGCYLWVLSLKQARRGDHARSASKKSPILGLSPPPLQHSLQSAKCSELPTATFLFLSNGENRASMPTEHWCEITQITAPRLASSPRQNSHMQCQPRGRVYNVMSPATPGAWILLLSGTTKQNSV